jgi:PAS domain S-box-containing protein
MNSDDQENHLIANRIHQLASSLRSADNGQTVDSLLQAVEALARVNERLELLIDSANLAWWDQDLVSNHVLRSRTWSSMLGYSEEEIGSALSAWKERIHPEDVQAVEQASARSKSGESPFYEVEHRMRNKAGEWVWIRNWGKIVERDAEGKPIRAVGFHLNITRRKQAELDREELLGKLERTIQELKTLRGIIPICSSCKKIRDDRGSWRQIESYIKEHSEAEFSHGMCPECVEQFYDELPKDRAGNSK